MKLYHGTTETVARLALTGGLKPRSDQAVETSNWRETTESHPRHVYLTDAYAGYFAFAACDEATEKWGIVEVDTELLDLGRLHPDEDFLEQATRGQAPEGCTGLAECGDDMKARTLWFRDHLRQFPCWDLSVESLGTCSYHGAIPPQAITRAAVFDPRSNGSVAMALLDPSITLLNYAITGGKYRALTAWLMGEDVDASLAFWPGGVGPSPAEVDALGPRLRDQTERWAEVLGDRAGLEVIAPPRDGIADLR